MVHKKIPSKEIIIFSCSLWCKIHLGFNFLVWEPTLNQHSQTNSNLNFIW